LLLLKLTTHQFQVTTLTIQTTYACGDHGPTMNSISISLIKETTLELLEKDKKLNTSLVYFIQTIQVNRVKNCV